MAVLITGASGGLGQAVVRSFLESGAIVFGLDRSWKGAPAEEGRLHRIEANLLDDAECRRVAQIAGPVNVLVHLIGGFAGGQPLTETTDAVWDQMMDLNVRTAFYMFRAVLPQMIQAGTGRIIAVGSRAAVEPMANAAAYTASKAALVSLVQAVAQEVKNTGVTVNAVLPSTIDTPANRSAMPKADFSKWVSPESIGNLVVWLASSHAADMNGAAIPIYGRL